MGRQLYAFPEGPIGLDHRVHLLEAQIRGLASAVSLLADSVRTADPTLAERIDGLLREVETTGRHLG